MTDGEHYDDKERYGHRDESLGEMEQRGTYGVGRVGDQGGYGSGRPISEYAANRDHVDPFKGHGQRNYADDDERIREELCDRLMQTNHVDCTMIDVDVRDGVVTLKGKVTSKEIVRMTEERAHTITGVLGVTNKLKVSD